MRIEAIQTYVVEVGCVVQIHTDSGIAGVGQSTYFASPHAIEQLVRTFAPSLVGKDPLDIERHWQYLHRSSSFRGAAKTSAIAAIDIALWDIAGKALGAPVWQLLGGRYRRKIRLYLNLGRASTVDELVEKARAAVTDGYTAVKVDPVPLDFLDLTLAQASREIVRRVSAIRDTVGPDIDLAVDVHNRLLPVDAIGLSRRLSSLDVLFYEDPIPPESIRAYGDLRQRVDVPIATGERLTNIHEFRELLEIRGADILCPDLGIAGGITGCKKVSAMAESHHVTIVPHHVIAPVATAAELHLDTSIPNFLIQPYLDDHLTLDARVLVTPFVPERGYLVAPDAPGLGVAIDEDYFQTLEVAPPPLGTPEAADGSLGHV